MCVGNRCSLDKIGFLSCVIFLFQFCFVSLIECRLWGQKMFSRSIQHMAKCFGILEKWKWKWFPAIYPRYKTSNAGNMHEKHLKDSNVASKWIFRSKCDDETIIVYCVCTFSDSIPSRKHFIQFDRFGMPLLWGL